VDGELRALREPGALPTTRQWSMLNRLGCIVIVEPRSADPLTRADAAGAIAAALRVDPGMPVFDTERPESLALRDLSPRGTDG
ncbi:MAG TPA: hypothetical protein VMK83_00395, partial [Gaiellaceae bacterium]|nr:hypothetical protein [Gaiellaceae bacterium]